MPDQLGDGDYVEDDLDGVSGLPDGLALFRKNLDEPLADICRLLGPKQFLATVRKKIPWGVGSIMSPIYFCILHWTTSSCKWIQVLFFQYACKREH